jgi:hypothetical protein
MAETASLERLLELARQLSARDKIRLIKRLAPQIERDLKNCVPTQHRSLRGLDLSENDIAEARREVWREFPREDVSGEKEALLPTPGDRS